MTKRPILITLATAAALALSLSACGGGSDTPTDTTPADTAATQPTPDPGDQDLGFTPVNPGKLTVCTNPPYLPFQDTDTATGTIVGFDMDLMAEVAGDLGLILEPRDTPFEAIESAVALNVGDCDVGASALTITEDRAAKMDFSEPYYEAVMGMLVMADSGITTLADLEGEAVGVQQGTTGDYWAEEQPELTNVRQFEGLGEQVTALKAGEVAGVLNDEPALIRYEEDGTMVMSMTFDTQETMGFAVVKGNVALLNAINTTLERLHNDGTFDEIMARWF